MAAERHDVTLYRGGSQLERRWTNLDPRDYQAARQLLEDSVLRVCGTLRLDLSQYWLEVIKPGNRPVEVRVSGSGETTINGKTAREDERYARR